ncbi:MAG: DUF2059 domain-containing protein [Paludibacter sp.]|nr:DUF2059 domain-containing protein [Paludibacter sp.]
MKKVILSSIFCFFILASSHAQTKQASIKELFHLMQTDSIIEKTFASIVPSILNQMPNVPTDAASLAKKEKMMEGVMKIAKDICTKMINEDMVVIYDKYFTQAEVDDFIRFYKTPAGQKFIKMTPTIQGDLMNIMMQKYMPEMTKSIATTVTEIATKESK